MALYSTIEPISRTEWPGGTLAYGGSCQGSEPYPASATAPYPTNQVLNYTPQSQSEYIYDPTKGFRRNWREIKKSGDISFTRYSRSRTTVNNFIVSRRYDLCGWKIHQQGCTTSWSVNRFGPLEGHTIYLRNSTIVEYDKSYDNSKVSGKLVELQSDLDDAIVTTQQAAFADATSSYDPLTELAELGETLKFLQGLVGGAASSLISLATSDWPTFKQARPLTAKQMLSSSNKALRALGSRWMAYRYALMPIYYSLRDINDAAKQRDQEYKTGRSRVSLSHSVTSDDYVLPAEGERTYGTCDIQTSVRSLFKVRYVHGALQRLVSQLSFNLFSTAWELVPLSFVLDWLWNINNAIIAATRIDSSTQSLGVTAIRTTRKESIYLWDTTVDRNSYYLGPWMSAPAISGSYAYARSTNEPLQETSTESYDRFLFTRPSPKIIFDPNLYWKRIIDGLVLSHQPIQKLLRSLR